jgi:hypothetical protein
MKTGSLIWIVTPAEAGVQRITGSRRLPRTPIRGSPGRHLDTGLRRYDVGGGFSTDYGFIALLHGFCSFRSNDGFDIWLPK